MSLPFDSPIAARWSEAVLVCRKCMKRQGRGSLRSDLRDDLKAAGRKDVRVIATGCMNLCPKHGVTVALGSELAAEPPRLHVLDNDHPARAFAAWLLAAPLR